MTQRERPAPDGGSQSAAGSPASLAAPPPPLLFAACADSSFWEQWYQHASAEQRRQVLDLAACQGVLCSCQLPAVEQAARRSPFAELLAGPARDLPPLDAPPLSALDPDLDETQRQAVARALATPDVALIRGYPGTGKTRVTAELLGQADRLGLRVLFVGASAAAVDRVLERLALDPAARALRCLGADESLDSLPSGVARLTVPGRLRLFAEQTLPAARRALERARAGADGRRRDAETWVRLEKLLAQREQALAERDRFQAQPADRQSIEAEVRQLDAWKESDRRHDEESKAPAGRLAEVRRELDQLSGELKQCDVQLQGLLPLAEARRSGRWWTGAYWRAAFAGDVQPRVEDLRHRCKESADRHDALCQQAEELSAIVARLDAKRDEEQDRLLDEEVARCQGERETRLAALQAALAQTEADWQSACAELSEGTARPASISRDELNRARAACEQQFARDEDEVALRARWLEALEATQPALAGHLRGSACVLAALPGGVPADAMGFDLLVVEEAGRLPDAELLAMARRAARCVLVGEPPLELVAPPGSRRIAQRSRATPRPAFERLWHALHADPRLLEPRWFVADGRLVARLRAVGAEQERWLQYEAVFDRPEIELGIVAPPRQEPRVVEVRFPAATPPEDARAFVFAELDELAVQTAGLAFDWREGEQAVTLLLDPGAEPMRSAVLGGGVREQLCRRAACAPGDLEWKTSALEFDRAAGWDLNSARTWAAARLGLRDTGRTTLLCRSYRARPELCLFLRDLLHAGMQPPPGAAGAADPPAVEFVPVPSLDALARGGVRRPADLNSHHGGSATATLASRPRLARGGAGVEIDLAEMPAGSRREALPAEVRAGLPARGLVNPVEARAILAALEDLVSEPAFQSASAAWQQRGGPRGPSVAVLSLLPAQAALLRLLVDRSPVVAKSGVPVEVGQPAELRQRECLAALVGLTRSHTHRAVPFTDHPESLALALTRPAARLVLFGDAGTLARRSQWNGALDHLDESAGTQEQLLVSRLLEALIEPEPAATPEPAWAGRSRESSGV